MGPEGTRFGRGPRELGGAVDLLNHYKLWPHHEFFCKKTLPLSISETRYLHNVVGDVKIRKGEGMELDQLFQNDSYVEDRHAQMHPFDLDILRDAFQMRETTPVDLQYAEKGIPTAVLKSNGEPKDKKKHKTHQGRDKDKDRKKRKHRHDNNSREKEEKKNGHQDFEPEHLQKQQDKNWRNDRKEDLYGIQRPRRSEVKLAKHKDLKINETGTLKIAR